MVAEKSTLHGFVGLVSLHLLLILPFALAIAQDQHTAKLIEAAKKEGELMWYTSMGLSDSKPMLDEFQRQYPFIKAKLYVTGALELLNRILTEARAGKQLFDVAESSSEMIPSLMSYRLTAQYRSPEMIHFDDDVQDKGGYWISTRVNPWVLGYNTKLVKPGEIPNDYNSLLLPKWKGGKISLDTDGFSVLQGLSLAWGKERAVDYLRRLADQKPIITRGNNQRVALMAAGEVPLAVAYAFTLERYKSKQGAPIDWVPLEPVPVESYVVVLASKAKHPNAGKLFVDFVLSQRGQEMMRDFYRVPTRKDVNANPPRLFRGYKRVIIGPEEQKEIAEVTNLYRQIFGIGK